MLTYELDQWPLTHQPPCEISYGVRSARLQNENAIVRSLVHIDNTHVTYRTVYPWRLAFNEEVNSMIKRV